MLRNAHGGGHFCQLIFNCEFGGKKLHEKNLWNSEAVRDYATQVVFDGKLVRQIQVYERVVRGHYEHDFGAGSYCMRPFHIDRCFELPITSDAAVIGEAAGWAKRLEDFEIGVWS